jgi:antitoxin HigA-1
LGAGAGHRKNAIVLNDHADDEGSRYAFKDIYARDVAPPHPGEILRDDIMSALDLSRAALAKRLGVTPRRLANLLSERTPITVDLAIRLGTVLGHGARYWLGLQLQYDLWLAGQPCTLRVKPLERWRQPINRALR